MPSVYVGPRRSARPDELAALERRGAVAQVKVDGWYSTLFIGAGGRIAAVQLRSGRTYLAGDVERARGRHPAGDLIGVATGLWPGTVIAAEMAVGTPESARWRRAHRGLAGAVVFDLLAVGDRRRLFAELAAGEVGARPFPAEDVTGQPQSARRAHLERLWEDVPDRARQVLELVPERRRRLRDFYDEQVNAGAEGIVVKLRDAPAGKGMWRCKRRDSLDVRVVEVLPDHGVIRCDWGGRLLYLGMPAFPVAVGDLVEVEARGFNDADRGEIPVPRHARALRVRTDLSPAAA